MTKKMIDQMYAFVVVDPEDDCEGIPAFSPQPGLMTPMVGADPERVMSLRSLAEKTATEMQLPIKLIRFSMREELEEILPGAKPEPEVLEVQHPGPLREEDGTITGWSDAPEPVLMQMDLDIFPGGIHVFAALLDGKPTVAFQFLKEGEEPGAEGVMKPMALQGEHASHVGPLAIIAYQTAQRALQQQQN